MQMSHDLVLKFLPHREPFLFIDSIEMITFKDCPLGECPTREHILGSEVLANFYVRPDMPLFQGHFPGSPILPGVIQIEMMAQAAGFPLAVIDPSLLEKRVEMALLGTTEAKFRRPVTPGMHLRIKSTCTKIRGAIKSYEGQIYCNNELMSEAQFLASIKY